jgi:hypothetical protein
LKITRFSLLAVFILFLAGCSAMNKKECITANWYTVGQLDAERGKPSSNIATYGKQCAKHSITPNQDSYNEGHIEGTKLYCTKDSGFKVGKKGKTYNGICPTQSEPSFKNGYSIGKEYYAVIKEINSLEYTINRAKKKAKKLIKSVANIKKEASKSTTTNERRIALREELIDKRVEAKIVLNDNQAAEVKLAVEEYKYTELVKKYGYE